MSSLMFVLSASKLLSLSLFVSLSLFLSVSLGLSLSPSRSLSPPLSLSPSLLSSYHVSPQLEANPRASCRSRESVGDLPRDVQRRICREQTGRRTSRYSFYSRLASFFPLVSFLLLSHFSFVSSCSIGRTLALL